MLKCSSIPTTYIIYKISETSWFRDITDMQALAHFEPNICKIFEIIKSLCAQLFEIFCRKISQKLDKTKSELNKSL